MSTDIQPVQIFIAYSHKDRAYLDELRIHATPLSRNQRLRIWFDGEIRPGEVWDSSIKENLHTAHVIILLLSANALHSEYFYEQEVREALERHTEGRARVVPVLLTPCLWDETPLAHLQGLPEGMKAISAWHDRDAAWENVLRGIRRIVGEIERSETSVIVSAVQPPVAKANPADEMLWKIARKNHSRTAYQGYLDKMPQGLHAVEASNILEYFDADDALWEYANFDCTQDTLESNLHDYLETFPDGLHITKAKEKLDEFDRQCEETERQKQQVADDKAGWDMAIQTNNEAAYQQYLTQYPGGLYLAQAKQRLAIHIQIREEAAYQKREQEEAQTRAREAAEKKKQSEETERKKLEAEEAARCADPFLDLMIPIKGGSFHMGDTFGDGGKREKPVHRVTIKDFHLCKYPVTQAQWKAIMGNNPAHFKGDANLPIEQVSWFDAQAFIKKLNEKTGQIYRLPSEAEWEYAAREGGKKIRFGNGKDNADPKEMNFDGREENKKVYSEMGKYRQKITPVNAFAPNALGLQDMSGNVWEWCQDMWHDSYKDAPDDGSAWEQGGDGSLRVVRGGSWDNNPNNCRAAYRNGYNPVNRHYYFGFRLAR